MTAVIFFSRSHQAFYVVDEFDTHYGPFATRTEARACLAELVLEEVAL